MFFRERSFSKEHPIGFRRSVIIEKQYLIVRITRSSRSHMLKNLLMVANFMRNIFLEFEKRFRTSIFLSASEGLLLNIPETSSSK